MRPRIIARAKGRIGATATWKQGMREFVKRRGRSAVKDDVCQSEDIGSHLYNISTRSCLLGCRTYQSQLLDEVVDSFGIGIDDAVFLVGEA